MRKYLSVALTVLGLIGAASLLGACHTTAGVGQDVTATGNALTNSAAMAKGRSQSNREAKKPKGGKKPAQAAATFQRPPPASPQPTTKQKNQMT